MKENAMHPAFHPFPRSTRRDFLAGATSGAALLMGGCGLFSRKGESAAALPVPDPGRELKVAVIGAGGQGVFDWQAVCQVGDRIAALCDVDESAMASAKKELTERFGQTDIHLYKDFRILFEKETDLDAVFIATPDHSHAVQIAWALHRKIPVYVEPPLVRTLGELDAIGRIARKSQTPLWQGLTNRTESAFRKALACLEAGLLGTPTAIHAWTANPLWPQGIPRPAGNDPIPDGFDWDLWLGPAPVRPYAAKAYHRFTWRGWCDFGTGALGDQGPALLNLPFKVFPLSAPETVQCMTPPSAHPESYPMASHLHYTFRLPKGGWFKGAPLTLDWYDGGLRPPIAQEGEQGDAVSGQVIEPLREFSNGRLPSQGCLLLGTGGAWLMGDAQGRRHAVMLNGDRAFVALDRHPACASFQRSARVIPLQKTFLNMIRLGRADRILTNTPTALMETILSGCVAQQVEGRLHFKGGSTPFKSHRHANACANQPMREGWSFDILE
ncbi:MAG: Gfo/Idh/MocA family oxidoreductase [Kiritimatiellae bacterium]|nr:Gfo/Idh/MocA family oxidoreductase [Kiritimatiellia bacterium]